ncbi:SRPBCC family protein [Myceligenerans indicum]|uniref:SRPBCC domain-containing protein n=1 Tax=Myceligenerans indicum TaxID=2593663 RepID=A0ABS1LR57_9MICO|nr:SRPBCC family protein [Myceligenerans indicum]MBL0888508.1 SRPBCC domain-containing protein [Myceligenerans indicum]
MSTDATRHAVTATTHIAESPDRVWAELVHPGAQWVLGTNLETDFRPGSPITFEGHFFGRVFVDKGQVIAVERPRLLHFTHFAPLNGLEDVPENHHEIRIVLEPDDGGTIVTVVQENIDSEPHAVAAERYWKDALATLAHRDGRTSTSHR